MTYYLLPKLYVKLTPNILDLSITDNEIEQFGINKSLQNYLNLIKKKIDLVSDNWDIYKKYTNPYEYIHSIISPIYKFSISKLKPLSRSFYKMIEIINIFLIFDDFGDSITSFHLAEGPGGFIEAFTYIRNNLTDKYYGLTLISEDNNNIPAWRKSKNFINKHPNINIEYGIDKTGNLMNKENLLYCLQKYKNSINIITGDGGFDFSTNFNKQEQNSINLIFAQISYALAMQKKGGTFILKVFDIFTYASLDLIYILSLSYNKVYISKPNSSRFANSEKYIICKDFKLDDSTDIVIKLSNYLDKLDNNIFIKRFLNVDISYLYKNKLQEINAIYGQQQIENINNTFALIDSNTYEKLENLKKNNIQKCNLWCSKYNIPYNKYLIY